MFGNPVVNSKKELIMKRYKPYIFCGYILVVIAIFSSCELSNDLEGSGHVTTKRYAVQNFETLDVDGVLNVYLQPGDKYKAEVRTDDNLQNIVKIEQNGDVLKVYSNTDSDFEATEMNIYITTPVVKEINLKGVTALYVKQPLRQSSLTIHKENTGYMLLTGSFQYLSIDTDGVGDMDLEGKSENMMLVNNMIGDFKAYTFPVNYLTMIHNGTGTVEIKVLQKLDIEMNGVGDVYCKSYPPEVSKSGSGIGRLYMVDGD